MSFLLLETVQLLSALQIKRFLSKPSEVPLFPFNSVPLSSEPFLPPISAEELKQRTKTKWTEMSAVYVGPFFKNCNIGAVKKTFNSLGPVQSITLVLETSREN